MQRWIWQEGWTSLHDAQERAIEPILDGDTDVIISAATAAGKTEAAFLPICSALASAPGSGRTVQRDPWTDHDPWAEPAPAERGGVDALYLSPLKALINDQYGRLDQLCESAEIPVHRWHGDVAGSAKKKVLTSPGGILLITPESLEALFVNRGTEISRLFGRLHYVVIDELHSFLSTPRGAQLQSLLSRVELAVRRRPPRIGLSATLGDLTAAARFLRPAKPGAVTIIEDRSRGSEIRLQLRGYRATAPDPTKVQVSPSSDEDHGTSVEADTGGDILDIADHLYRTLRGDDHLVFANSRSRVEVYADLLTRRCERERVPNEFWPHHGSLAKDMREDVEAALKDPTRPVTAICTSTLEMGIDIGSVKSVAQVGTPPSVASLRQRLGRSGRRDSASTLRLYITERELDSRTAIADELRCALVQTVAMVRLMLDGWVEPPAGAGLNLSTLIQQVMSVIAQHGGATAAQLHSALCGPGPFEEVDQARFTRLLRAMAARDLIVQSADGTLLHGVVGERAVNHYSFYTAFQTPQDWRLVAAGRLIGTMPIDRPLIVGDFLIFGGRRWRIVDVETSSRTIELVRGAGGKPPAFGGEGSHVDDRVRSEMVRVYRGEDDLPWLDAEATSLLAEGRAAWRRLDLDSVRLLPSGGDTLVLPWAGDKAMVTAGLVLASVGIGATAEGPVLRAVGCDVNRLRSAADRLLSDDRPDPLSIARLLANTEVDKWDHVLDAELAAEATVSRLLDLDSAWRILGDIAEGSTGQPALNDQGSSPQRATVNGPFARQEFCVVDVETTGFSPRLGDRVIEVAALRIRGDGEVLDEWSTLVDPSRSLGAIHVHGIGPEEILGAPAFEDVAGDLLGRMQGAVLVAHNLRFDRDFLAAELALAGVSLPALPATCTMALAARLVPEARNRKLAACCERIGHPIPKAHSALDDARAASALLVAYLTIAEQAGATALDHIGCAPLEWPLSWPELAPSGRRQLRGGLRAPVEESPSHLARVVARLDKARTGSDDDDISAYHDVLSRALEDRQITEVEAQALVDTAAAWGIDRTRMAEAHAQYVDALVSAALEDDILTDAERSDVENVARLLGVPVPDLTQGRDRATPGESGPRRG